MCAAHRPRLRGQVLGAAALRALEHRRRAVATTSLVCWLLASHSAVLSAVLSARWRMVMGEGKEGRAVVRGGWGIVTR